MSSTPLTVWEFGATLPVTLSCDSCGKECASACGTRHFRSCCFNYLRKRSGPDEIHHPTRLKLELWFAKSQLEKVNFDIKLMIPFLIINTIH